MSKNRLALYLAILVGLFTQCVQPTYERTLIIQVDTTGTKNVNAISVRGDFAPLSWEEGIELNFDSTDLLFKGTVILNSPFEQVELKFVANNHQFELPDKPNRSIRFNNNDTLIYKATFNQCADCTP